MFAYTQSENEWDYVTIKQIVDGSKMPRGTVYRYINRLMDEGLIYKFSRGKYRVSRNKHTMSVGYAVLTPLDIHGYWSKKTEMLNKKR